MSGMAAFTRKELVENVRTYRMFLMLALFFFLEYRARCWRNLLLFSLKHLQ